MKGNPVWDTVFGENGSKSNHNFSSNHHSDPSLSGRVRSVEMAELLWRHVTNRAAFVNGLDRKGNNCLHLLIKRMEELKTKQNEEQDRKSLLLFQWFVVRGANVLAHNRKGKTPISLLHEKKHPRFSLMLHWLTQHMVAASRFTYDLTEKEGALQQGQEDLITVAVTLMDDGKKRKRHKEKENKTVSTRIEYSGDSYNTNDKTLTITAGKKRLSVRCPKFRGMFRCGHMKESGDNTVHITVDSLLKQRCFSYLLSFVSTGFLPCDALENADEVQQLTLLADEYLLDDLKFICENSLIFHVKEGSVSPHSPDSINYGLFVIPLLAFADMLNLFNLKTTCMDKVGENFQEWCCLQEFSAVVTDNPSLMKEVLMVWSDKPSSASDKEEPGDEDEEAQEEEEDE